MVTLYNNGVTSKASPNGEYVVRIPAYNFNLNADPLINKTMQGFVQPRG